MSSSEKVKSDLKKIAKVGTKAANALFAAGYTLERVAEAPPADIKDVLHCSMMAAKLLVSNAQKILGAAVLPPMTADEYEEEVKASTLWIKTGSKKFNEMLGGGFPTSSTAGIGGHQATGKTQLGFELLLYTQNVLKADVLFVETELNTFSPRRLRQMAAARGWEYDGSKVVLVPARRIKDCGTQYYQYQRARDRIEAEGRNIKLIIIDSLTALFQRKFTGRELLPNRKAELGRHLTFLEDCCKKWNALLFVTCQVLECPVSPGEAKGGFSSASVRAQFRTGYMVWGGHILRHTLGTWLMVTKKKADIWQATLFDSSELKADTIEFVLTEKGLEDYVEKKLV